MNQITAIFDFILPRICPACSKTLHSKEQVICATCFKEIKRTSADLIESEFKRKFAEEKIIADFIAPFVFENEKALQQLIHQLKYNNRFRLGIYLGKKLAKLTKAKVMEWEADCIVPIPLHPAKKAERGYNQADFIAKGIAKELSVAMLKNGIKRNINTPTQTKLNLEERRENMENAFEVNTKKVVGKKIILLDDVITTGSTMRSCAIELLNKGAQKVYGLSVAIADI